MNPPFTYFQKYGVMPFGGLAHGTEGILDYFMESFGVKDGSIVLRFIDILASGEYIGTIPCPCGSGPMLERCHGSILREMMKLKPPIFFSSEYIRLFVFLHGQNILGKCKNIPSLIK